MILVLIQNPGTRVLTTPDSMYCTSSGLQWRKQKRLDSSRALMASLLRMPKASTTPNGDVEGRRPRRVLQLLGSSFLDACRMAVLGRLSKL